jgi:hypothetical protein
VNADGDVEKRMVDWEGETLEVNYVTRFTDAMSCDIVTTPARGGKFLALVESIAGAMNKEDTPMKKGLEKSLEEVRSLLKEASKEKDAKVKATKVTEAHNKFEAFLKEAAEAEVEAKKDEDKVLPVKEANPVKKGYEAALVCPHCGKGISMPEKKEEEVKPEAEAENCEAEDEGKKEDEAKKESSEDEVDDKNSPAKGDDGPDDDVIESKRQAVKSLLVEANLEKHLDVKDFEEKSFKDAKSEIERISKIVEAERKAMYSKTGIVPVGFRNKISESTKDIDADSKMADILKK